MLTKRVFLDKPSPEGASRGCGPCPFFWPASRDEHNRCVVTPDIPGPGGLPKKLPPIEDENGMLPTPDWCPLRVGPVTVEGH